MENTHMPYEGAGFLLYYQNLFVLGIRYKKEADMKKDPTPEVEYMGGKIEVEDENDPLKTAFRELVEEIGQPILEDDWKSRVTPIHTYQPFSQKWIHCSLLQLNENEYNKIFEVDKVHDAWPTDETRDLSSITGRSEPVRKAISAFVTVTKDQLLEYMYGFSKTPASKNRMADAKAYRNSAKPLVVTRMSTNETFEYPLRGFNTVIFEEHVDAISKHVV